MIQPVHRQELLARVTCHLKIRDLQNKLTEANGFLEKRVKERTTKLELALTEVETLKNRFAQENSYLQEEIKRNHEFDKILTKNENYLSILKSVEQVASTDATVLIQGETGTGKELVARAIHSLSKRQHRPLVKVNCGALPANLMESELFGHEKGAFTGAIEKRIGRFELAHEGTIFLDEIGDQPIETQVKLLRTLQEGEIERVGNPYTVKVNTRVIAATNRDLKKAIECNEFREDLYFRLNVFPLYLPPLRERKEDIPILARYFLKRSCLRLGKPILVIPDSLIGFMRQYPWPGNVRELENMIERAAIVSSGEILEVDNFEHLKKDSEQFKGLLRRPSNCSLKDLERMHIAEVLKQCKWRIEGEKGGAKLLGLNPSTLRSKMKKLGIIKPEKW